MALSNLIIESEVDETVFEYDASSEEKLLDDLGFLLQIHILQCFIVLFFCLLYFYNFYFQLLYNSFIACLQTNV